MPYISVKTTAAVSGEKEKAIKEKFARAMEKNLGKGESWLMISFEDGMRIWFKGNDTEHAAMVDIQIFGRASSPAYEAMTADVCRILTDELAVPGDRIYVKYGECQNWGWNGGNF